MTPSIALIIPSLDGEVEPLLASVRRQTWQPAEIAVVRGVRPNGKARNQGVAQTTAPILVFVDDGRSMGLVVDEIVDIVEESLNIEVASAQEGLLGSAVIKGQATEVIDVGHFLPMAFADWPSANSCRISRCRGVSRATGLPVFSGSRFMACNTSPASAGVRYVLPSRAARMAPISSAGAECLRTNPEAPRSKARRA